MCVQVVAVPVAAAGLLHCISAQLSARDYWAESTALVAVPGCLRLLLMVAHSQRQMLQQVRGRADAPLPHQS